MRREPSPGRAKAATTDTAPTSEPMTARLYVDGVAKADSTTIDDAVREAEANPRAVAFVFGDAAEPADLAPLATILGWDRRLLDTVLEGRQRPKLERRGDSIFIVVRAALYVDEQEDILFSEFHVVLTGRVVVVVRRGVDNVSAWSSQSIDTAPDILAQGPAGFLCGVIARIVELYAPVIDGVSIDVEQIESQVFGGDDAAPARIYRLGREVVDFQQAAAPMLDVVRAITDGAALGSLPAALREAFVAVADRLTHVAESIDTLRDQLDRILSVNGTLVAQRQNEDMKRISSWAAILFAPTVVTGVYGMNFRYIPELAWPLGYPLALLAMIALGVVLWFVFKRRGWL